MQSVPEEMEIILGKVLHVAVKKFEKIEMWLPSKHIEGETKGAKLKNTNMYLFSILCN